MQLGSSLFGLVFRWVLHLDWDQRSAKKCSCFSFGLSNSLSVSLRPNFGLSDRWIQSLTHRLIVHVQDRSISKRLSLWQRKLLHFFANSKINKKIWQNQRWVADEIRNDALQWMIKLNIGLRPRLSRLVSVFGLSERLIHKVKWPSVLQET